MPDTAPATMNVNVRDRAAEAPWGVGLTSPRVRAVTISAVCPVCGGPRGEPRPTRQHDDGVTYWPDTWSNPCGHVDDYAAVVREAAALEAAAEAVPVYPAPGSPIPGQPGYVVGTCEHRLAASEWAAGCRTCERC